MPLTTLVSFVVTSLLLIFSPGPDILYVLARSVTQGRRAGLAAALGFASGLPVHTSVAAFGLAVALRSSPWAFRVIAGLGAAYLLYLAIRTLRSHAGFVPAAKVETRTLRSIYFQCFTMNLLNPKVALFFLALLPGFCPPDSAHPTLIMLLLGLLFAVLTVLSFSSVALLAGTLGNLLRTRPVLANTLRYLTALVFLALALNLAVLIFLGSPVR